MGLTPVEGLVMGTRCGDIDPAILPFLQNTFGYSANDVDDLINKQSGLLGISGIGNDMRDIEDNAKAGNERARLALEIFCYRGRKYIGAYAAAMGGLDALVFTAGIGEHSPVVRSMNWRSQGRRHESSQGSTVNRYETRSFRNSAAHRDALNAGDKRALLSR
jgi:acetate kinase